MSRIKNIVINNNGSSSLAYVFFLQVTGSSEQDCSFKNFSFLSTVVVPCGSDGFVWLVAPSGTSFLFLFDAVFLVLVTGIISLSGLLFSWESANFKSTFVFTCTNLCFSWIEAEFSLESVFILCLNE